MKYLLILICIIFFSNCVYDPAKKGKEIYINNQSPYVICVIDGFSHNDPSRRYDTSIINRRTSVIESPNFVKSYGQWEYFFDDDYRRILISKGMDSISFSFRRILSKCDAEILRDSIKILKVSINDLESSTINIIFYFNDSIYYDKELNVKMIRRLSDFNTGNE